MITAMNTNDERVFVGDFETTVYEGQTKTEVILRGLEKELSNQK